MNKLFVIEIVKSDNYEGIVKFSNSRGNSIYANFWGQDFEIGKSYMVEFSHLEYSLRWEEVFSENINKQCKIDQAENQTAYNCYGIIESINPTVADFGDLKLSIGELSNDQKIVDEFIYWKIFRLDVFQILELNDLH
ncbi:hypothetical protein LV84_03066 [Algoriphagus ratkowskyi]|uniref:Uncharacterized protein n=1 Tax=Algoriphagus ratkowskyi TaxID=57028 RepID=A0A2W7QZJ7_9BACT|nr:hypothetical protein [Algoriphagus ratkowskyi]PZX53958.1 hypothetical protein LV84_03066 [Algoriphagus ratkowskyi]TXD76642.1 hypothetical protein ESW18_14865 [Algoriphagus ratkowskyi]